MAMFSCLSQWLTHPISRRTEKVGWLLCLYVGRRGTNALACSHAPTPSSDSNETQQHGVAPANDDGACLAPPCRPRPVGYWAKGIDLRLGDETRVNRPGNLGGVFTSVGQRLELTVQAAALEMLHSQVGLPGMKSGPDEAHDVAMANLGKRGRLGHERGFECSISGVDGTQELYGHPPGPSSIPCAINLGHRSPTDPRTENEPIVHDHAGELVTRASRRG